MMRSLTAPRRFAIAVSFPGEHRKFVRNVVKELAEQLGRDRVFYDEWYEGELVGSDGDLKLKRYYREQCEMVVPFFSKHYGKPWCRIEWHAIRAILLQRRAEDAVVPVELDGTHIDGWEPVDFAIRRGGRTATQIAEEILAAYRQRQNLSASSADTGIGSRLPDHSLPDHSLARSAGRSAKGSLTPPRAKRKVPGSVAVGGANGATTVTGSHDTVGEGAQRNPAIVHKRKRIDFKIAW